MFCNKGEWGQTDKTQLRLKLWETWHRKIVNLIRRYDKRFSRLTPFNQRAWLLCSNSKSCLLFLVSLHLMIKSCFTYWPLKVGNEEWFKVSLHTSPSMIIFCHNWPQAFTVLNNTLQFFLVFIIYCCNPLFWRKEDAMSWVFKFFLQTIALFGGRTYKFHLVILFLQTPTSLQKFCSLQSFTCNTKVLFMP